MIDKIETGLLLDYYGGILTEKQQSILRFYCDRDLSLSEIASDFGVSRQAVLDIIDRGEEKLRLMEEKMGLVGKIRKISSILENKIRVLPDGETKKTLQEILTEIKEI